MFGKYKNLKNIQELEKDVMSVFKGLEGYNKMLLDINGEFFEYANQLSKYVLENPNVTQEQKDYIVAKESIIKDKIDSLKEAPEL